MSMRSALRAGGTALVLTLGVARFVDSLDLAAMTILAPDIQKTLGVSDAVLGAIGGAFGVLVPRRLHPHQHAGRPPPSKAHRRRLHARSGRRPCSSPGSSRTAFWLFLARLGVGISQAYAIPVNAPLLADGYPIEARSRVFAVYGAFETGGRIAGPLIAGGIAGAIAGPASWRWVFVGFAMLGVPVAIATLLLKEPRRGRNEMQAVLGGELVHEDRELPVSVSVAFERLRTIRSFYYFLTGMAALGFALSASRCS